MIQIIKKYPVQTAIAGLVLVGLGVYTVNSLVNGAKSLIGFDDDTAEEQKEINELIADMGENKADGMTTDYSTKDFLNAADKLEIAMKGFGMDADAVAEVFSKIKNPLEVRMLIKAFGVRDGDNLIQWLTYNFFYELWVNLPDGRKIYTANTTQAIELARKILKENNVLFAL